ncbi:uncharacterized protein F4812DRAFT_462057 [Daldinia caldariorum]|uniref:uncharacterized protein n=1 Tax=Daldinia caldariorum TaxID=326644 RepID=UPI002007D066|nr:uncharacterized protein F4812DRAFT_462057 [Daldinia caldariorum]KAI1465212.1 hypothetical protein F4812DRAFT_462057 [Daldinia caldariorum]
MDQDTETGPSEDFDISDGSDEADVDETAMRKLKEIQLSISDKNLNLQPRDALLKFLNDKGYMDYVTYDPGYDRENLLHSMAQSEASSELVKYLIEEAPNLMDGVNISGLRPLSIAIKRKNNEFITAVLESYSANQNGLADLLDQGGDKENCIHEAIISGLDPDLVTRLILQAHSDTLEAPNGAGMTPLHLAVDYRKCIKGQFDVVRALLERNDAGLDKVGGKPDFMSVYRYHTQHKPRVSNKQEPNGRSFGNKEILLMNDGLNNPLVGKGKYPKNIALNEEESAKRREYKQVSIPNKAGETNPSLRIKPEPTSHLRRVSTSLIYKTPQQSADLQPMALLNVQPPLLEHMKSADEGRRMGNADLTDARRPGGDPKRKPRTKKYLQRNKQEAILDTETAAKIDKELKLHYLRSIFEQYNQAQTTVHTDQPSRARRNHDTAVQFLYGDNKKNMHICFSFLQGPSKMSATKFELTYQGFNFDSVLQYVAFRQVQFTKPQKPLRRNDAVHKPPEAIAGNGRRDMEVPFEWLYQAKGVRNIIKVIVDDLESPSHSDESIETALKRFDIEILDWRKIDLCPETICNSCKNLRVLHLWWSGNNAMLRAWSEPDGLVKLQQLKAIHLHQTQDLDSELWTQKKVEQFRERLKKARDAQNKDRVGKDRFPDIHVPPPLRTTTINERHHGDLTPETDPKVQRKTHNWLHIMDTFADGIAKFTPHREGSSAANLPEKLRNDVTVALIDDGVQFGHESLQGKIIDGWSFDDGYDGADLPGARKPFHESQTGHGTLMANMICRVCPAAKIFVCRLKVVSGNGSKSHFTAESAAEAVEYCATRGFDIISISWTVMNTIEARQAAHDKNPDGKSPTERIDDALSRAYRNGALIFCAAPDEGLITSIEFHKYYPVGCPGLSTKIFKIGAATANNVGHSQTGEVGQIDFILPGHEVTERDEGIDVEKNSPKTGSSIATALAAGLAALVIHCVRLAAIETYQKRQSGEEGERNTTTNKTLDANSITEGSLNAVKKPEAMKRIFEHIPGGSQDSSKFLEVNSTFGDLGKFLCDTENSTDSKLGKIAYLARDFVGWAR